MEYLSDNLSGHVNNDSLIKNCFFHRDTVMYLLQQLGFALNLKKSVLEPAQTIEFVAVDSRLDY